MAGEGQGGIMIDLRAYTERPFLCEPAALQRFFALAAQAPPLDLQAARSARPSIGQTTQSKIGVVDIFGFLDQRLSPEIFYFGGTTTEEISAAIDHALSDPSIGQLVLRFDSPGGSPAGIMELSEKLLSLRESRKIIGMVDGLCCSAAFWLGTCCSELHMTPSGTTASVGVFMAHVSEAGALEKAGIDVTMISSK